MSETIARRTAAVLAATTAIFAVALAPAAPAVAGSPATSPSRWSASQSTDRAGDDRSRLLLMLDASGSMKKADPSGLTKMEAAKRALTSVVTQLPEDSDVGLRVYGATVDSNGKPTQAACADTQLVAPVGPLDRPALTTAIQGFSAVGETPIAHSLELALDDLGGTGKRTIVLVSDGEESCVPDPCPVVRKLVGAGVDLRIDTVGFAVDAAARKQLTCIAAAGNGTYYDAVDADRLTESLTRISVRAARQFGVTGTRVTGSLGTENGAPTLTAGQYIDTFTTGGAARHYSLRRTIPHSTLHVAVTARPGVDLEGGGSNGDTIEFTAFDDEGRSCTDLPGRASRNGLSSLAYVITDSLSVEGGTVDEPGDCGASMEVPLEIAREGSAEPVDAEVLVIEEPPVTDVATLPAPAEKVDAEPADAGDATPVIGGTNLTDATPITPGTWTEQYVSGETIFYRVPVDWGQTLTVTVGPVLTASDTSTGLLFDARLYDPTRGLVEPGPLAFVGKQDDRVIRETAPIRYRNREQYPTRFSSLAGQYYLAVSVPKVAQDSAVPMQVTFRLEVTGEPSGGPDYVVATSSTSTTASSAPSGTEPPAPPAASPAAADAASGSVWPWLAGGFLLIVAVAVGVRLALSRRRASTTA